MRVGNATDPVIPERLETLLDSTGCVDATDDVPQHDDGQRHEEKTPFEDIAILEEERQSIAPCLPLRPCDRHRVSLTLVYHHEIS